MKTNRTHLIESPNFVCYLQNDEMLKTHLQALRNAFKAYRIPFARLALHPRHSNRKGLFQTLGKHYSTHTENHPPVKYAQYFGVYVKFEVPKGVDYGEYSRAVYNKEVKAKVISFTHRSR